MKLFFSLLLMWTSLAFSDIRVIVFDFGGVVGKLDRRAVTTAISKSLRISQKESQQLLVELKQYLLMGGDEEIFWKNVATQLGRPISSLWLQEFRDLHAPAVRTIPGTLPLIRKLRDQGYQTALLSNVSCYKADVYKSLGLYSYFDPILLSCELNMRKPDPNIYLALLNRLDVATEECLFVDDKEENVRVARSLGIDSILFKNASQLAKELVARGIAL